MRKAGSLKRAAELLWEHEVKLGNSQCVGVLLMLCGNCIEALLKGSIFSTGVGIEENGQHLEVENKWKRNNLVSLWHSVFNSVSQKESSFLERLTLAVEVNGRSPTTLSSARTSDYHFNYPCDWNYFLELEEKALKNLAACDAKRTNDTLDARQKAKE